MKCLMLCILIVFSFNSYSQPTKEDFLQNKSASWLFTCISMANTRFDKQTDFYLSHAVQDFINQGAIIED